MSRYKRVSVHLWGDEKFRALSPLPPSGQSLWLYLLCGPQTTGLPGVFSIGEAALAERLGWPLETFRLCWAEISAQKLAKADFKAPLILLPKALNHNPPASQNVVMFWRSEFEVLPDCELKGEAFSLFSQYFKASKTFAKFWFKTLPKVLPKTLPKTKPYITIEGIIEGRDREKEKEGRATGRTTEPPPTTIITPSLWGMIESWLDRSQHFQASGNGLRDKRWWYAQMEAFPELDFDAELRKADAWLASSRRRYQSWPRFLHGWFNRARAVAST